MFSLQLPSFRIGDEAIYPESKREFLLFCDYKKNGLHSIFFSGANYVSSVSLPEIL